MSSRSVLSLCRSHGNLPYASRTSGTAMIRICHSAHADSNARQNHQQDKKNYQAYSANRHRRDKDGNLTGTSCMRYSICMRVCDPVIKRVSSDLPFLLQKRPTESKNPFTPRAPHAQACWTSLTPRMMKSDIRTVTGSRSRGTWEAAARGESSTAGTGNNIHPPPH